MRRSSGALIRRLNLSISSYCQQPGTAVKWLQETGASHGAASDSLQPLSGGPPCLHVLEALGLRSLATRRRLSLKGSKGLGLKRRQAAAEATSAMAGPLRNFEEQESLSSSSYTHDVGRGDADDLRPPRPRAGKASRFDEELESEEVVWGAGGGWGGVGGSKGGRGQKVPAPSMGLKASHAEFYKDEPPSKREAGRAPERGRGGGRAVAAEEAEAEYAAMVGREPEHKRGRGDKAAAFVSAAEEAEAATGWLSRVPGSGRGLPKTSSKGMPIPRPGTAIGGLGMGALAAAQAGGREGLERVEESSTFAEEDQDGLSERGVSLSGRGEKRWESGGKSRQGAGKLFGGQGEPEEESQFGRRGSVQQKAKGRGEGSKGETKNSGQVGQDQGIVTAQPLPTTLTQLKQQANSASEPEHVLKVLLSADQLLDVLRASTKPSPQLDKQVAGVHSLLHSLSLQLLLLEQQQHATATKPSPKAGLQLSQFHGLQLAGVLRLLGKTGSIPPAAVQEGILSELLADDCQKLLTASPLAWVQVLQGIHLIRSSWERLQRQQRQADSLDKGSSHEAAHQDGIHGLTSTPARTEDAGPEAPLPEGARAVQTPQLANLEHDLMEVICSMLISAAEHMEPDTVVMVGSYLARMHNCKKELFEAITGVVAPARHRLSDKTASQLGMLARSLANEPQLHVPSLLNELAALVMERNAKFVTSQGWPDLLRAYSQHLHPCPGLVGLLADSAGRHLPHLSFQKLTSLAISVMLLEPHTPQGLRLLQATCAAVPANLGDPGAKAPSAGRMLHALAAARFRDPACLQPLLATTTAAWLPQLTALVDSAHHHATVSSGGGLEPQQLQPQPLQASATQSDTAHDAMIPSDAAAAQSAAVSETSASEAAIASNEAAQRAAVEADASSGDAASASDTTAQAAEVAAANDATAAAVDLAPTATPAPEAPTPVDHEAAVVPSFSGSAQATPATSDSASNAPTPLDHAAAAVPTSSGSAKAAMVASITRASALTDAMFKSAPPRAATALDSAWKSARPASLLTHMHNTPYQQLLHPLAALADVGVLNRTQSACLAEAVAMSLAIQQPIPSHAHASTSSNIHSSSSSNIDSSSRSSISTAGSTGNVIGSLSHALDQQGGARAASNAAIESSDGSGDDGVGHVGDDGQVVQHSAHSMASQTDLLLSFVHSALQGPLWVGGNLESFKAWSQISSPEEEEQSISLFAGKVLNGSKAKTTTDVHSYWSLPTYRQLMAHSLAMVRALGLGDALHARRGVHEAPFYAGLPAYLRPWMKTVQQPAMPDIQFVSALMGGHTPVQEVLYRLPSDQQEQEQEHSSLHDAQLGLQRGSWEAASEVMRSEEGSMSESIWEKSEAASEAIKSEEGSMGEGSGKESESQVGMPGSISTSGSEGGEGESSSSSIEDDSGSNSSSSSSSSSSDSSFDEERFGSSSSSSKEDDKWSVETQAGCNQEASFENGALHSGDTNRMESMAALQPLLLRAGTRQSEASYVTLMLASTLSSVLLGQGISSPAMQQLLVADGRLVIAGAMHHSSWAAGAVSSSSSSSEHKPRSDEGGCSSGSVDATPRSSAVTASELGTPHVLQQDAAPHTPVAVMLVRTEDFCQTLPTATESSDGSGHAQQQGPQQQHLQQTPMGDLVLRRWLLRAAGVHVVEVAEAEWAAVMKHEAAAALLISEALQQQQQQQ